MAETPAITNETMSPMVKDLMLACQEVLKLWPSVGGYHTSLRGEAMLHVPMQHLAMAMAHLQKANQAAPKGQEKQPESRVCGGHQTTETTIQEESASLNTQIDDIYDQLAVLAAKRRAGQRDAGLEEQITHRFQRLRTLQAQEANLIRGMIPSTRTSNVETGLAILKRVEQLREKSR